MTADKYKYRALIENMPDAVAHHQIVTDSNSNPVDYIFLNVNRAFEEMTGLSRDDILGKKVTAVLPEIEASEFDWIGTYGKVALTGESVCFEQYAEPLDRWYAVTAYRDEPGYFVTTFCEITTHKQELASQETLSKLTEELLQLSASAMDYQVPVAAMQKLSGAKYVAINTYEEDGTKSITRAIAGVTTGIRRASEVLGFELTGKAWDIIPERVRNIKGGKLVRFSSLYEASMGAISKKTAVFLEKIFSLGDIHVIELAYGESHALGDIIFFIQKGKTLQNREAIEIYASQLASVLMRFQSEKELAASETRFRQMADNMTEVFWVSSADNLKVLYISPAYEKVWGRSCESLYENPDTFMEAVIDEDKPAVYAELDRYLNEDIFDLEYRIVRPDGEVRWVWARSFPVRGERCSTTGHTGIAVDITGRKQKEEALRNSEAKYRMFSENARDIIWTTDLNLNFTYISPAVEQVFGYTAEEFTYLSIDKTLPPTSLELVMQVFQQELAIEQSEQKEPGRTRTIELAHVCKDGSTVWTEVKMSFLRDEDELPTGILGITRDITQRKQVIMALRESEKKLQEAQHIAKLGRWELDLKTNHLHWTPTIYEIFEIDPLKFSATYDAFLEAIHPEDRERVNQAYTNSLIERKPYTVEHRLLMKDGRIKWVQEICHTDYDAQGQAIRSVGVVQDITDHKAATLSLVNSEKRYRQLIEDASIAIVVGQDNLHKFANPKASELFGYPIEILTSKPISQFFHPEDSQTVVDRLASRLEGNEESPTNIQRIITGDGKTKWVESNQVLIDWEGRPASLVFFIDITKSKHIQAYNKLSGEVLGILNESSDIHDSIQRILNAITLATGCDAVGMRLQNGNDFPYYAQHGFSDEFLLSENSLLAHDSKGNICQNPDGSVSLECTCGLVVSGKTDPSNSLFTPGGSCWTNDSFPHLFFPASDDPRLHPRNQCIHQGFASVALVPLRKNQQIVGLLQLNDRRKDQFSLDVINALEGIANHIGEALSRKQAAQELQKSEERYRLLVDNANEAINIIQDGIHKFVNPKAVELFGRPIEELLFKPVDAFVHPEDKSIVLERIEKRMKKQLSHDKYKLRIIAGDGSIKWTEVNAVVIEWEGNPASLSLINDITDRREADEALQFLLHLEQMTAYISNLFIKTPAEKMDEALEYALQRTGKFFDVDRSYVFMFSEDGQFMTNTHEWHAQGIEPQKHSLQNISVSTMPWWEQEMRQLKPVTIRDVDALPAEASLEKEELKRQDIQSVLCIPMAPDGILKGFLGFDSVRDKKEWPPEQTALVRVIAETMAIAMERRQSEQKLADYTLELEELYHQLDEELNKARQMHERTMPTALPTVSGLSFASHYQPAKKLGGDFYNVIQSGNKLIFYLSDVSGHGLDGAMLSVFIKEAIDSYVDLKPDDISPHKILQHLSRQFSRGNYPEELYICILMTVLDLETMKFTFSGAGFQDALLVQLGDGEKIQLNSKGLFITSYYHSEMMDFHEESITLTPGTTIFFNTDGLSEQENQGEYYMDRLSDVFYKNAHLPPQLVAQTVIEDFRKFNGNSLQGNDDITFVVLQVDPPEKEIHHLELAGDLRELIRLRKKTESILKSIKIGIKDGDVFLAGLYEMATNAIEHGNRQDPEKTVSVKLTVTNRYLQATVHDQGAGFNWREKIEKSMDLYGNQERGRGIAMTRMCCDQLFYNVKGNQVTLVVTNRG